MGPAPPRAPPPSFTRPQRVGSSAVLVSASADSFSFSSGPPVHHSWNTLGSVDHSAILSSIVHKQNATTLVYDGAEFPVDRVRQLMETPRIPASEQYMRTRAMAILTTVTSTPKVEGLVTYKQLLGMGSMWYKCWGDIPPKSDITSSMCTPGMPILDNTIVSLKYETNAPFITSHNAFLNLFTTKMFDMTTSD